MTPLLLAWANLSHKRARTAIASGGVAFAVILIFMEIGLLGGVGRTATMLYDNMIFDLLLTSSEYLDMSRPGDFPRARLAQARAADGVADTIPISFGVGGWRLPPRSGLLGRMPGGGVMSINLIAAPPDRIDRAFRVGPGQVFPSPEDARTCAARLGRLDSFLIDRRSKSEFGDADSLMAADPDGTTGIPVRFNGQRVAVVGHFDLGTGFSWNGMLMSSEETFTRVMMRPADDVNFGLIQLRSGTDPVAVQDELRRVLPSDVKLFTREEINASERNYWLRLTSIGQFLVVAVILAVVVGIIFVYQMMAADIRNMLPEFATVKALGYPPKYLTYVVLCQAASLAVLGYVPGLVAAFALFTAARVWGGIPAGMSVDVAVGVLVLTFGMCLASGLLAVRKVHAADPADLF